MLLLGSTPGPGIVALPSLSSGSSLGWQELKPLPAVESNQATCFCKGAGPNHGVEKVRTWQQPSQPPREDDEEGGRNVEHTQLDRMQADQSAHSLYFEFNLSRFDTRVKT